MFRECPCARTDEAGNSSRGTTFYSQCRLPETGATEHRTQASTQSPFRLDVCCGDGRHSHSWRVEFNLCGSAVRTESGFQRDCGLARGNASQFVACGCCLNRPAHSETVVPGQDPFRIQFAGPQELRVLSTWRQDDLSPPNAGRAPDLRCSEASHIGLRVSGKFIATQVVREYSLAPEPVVQCRNMESRWASLFRDRRRKCC